MHRICPKDTRMIANIDIASTSSTESLASDSSLSTDDSLPSTVPSRVPPSSRASVLSRKRRAANVLPNIGFDGDSSRRAHVNNPSDVLSASDDDGSKRLRASQGSDSSRSIDQIAQIECSQGSVSSSSPVSGSKKIEHIVEGYKIISVGTKEFTAVQNETDAVMQVIVFNTSNECAQYQRVISRLNEADKFSTRTASNIQRMRKIQCQNSAISYVI
uniref:Protein kinase domain-containing protein n=1 Tax=Steinernema glaseri TaxID=37863 RepID=A0A1I8AI19_9BILA